MRQSKLRRYLFPRVVSYMQEYETINFQHWNFFWNRSEQVMEFSIASLGLANVVGYLLQYRVVIYVLGLLFVLSRPRKAKLRDIWVAYRYDVSPTLKLLLWAVLVAAFVLTLLVTFRFISR